MLSLQAAVGNRAVGRLLARTPRDDLADKLRREYGVGTIRAGTQADQVAELAAQNNVAPGTIAITGWQAWDPAPTSPIYADIAAAFDDMDRVLGGVPPVREIRFMDAQYELAGGNAVAVAGTGADFGSGVLTVYRRFETAYWGLPVARSVAGATYDTGGELAVGNPGTGAPSTTSGHDQSRRRIIVHELSHGVSEVFGTPRAGLPPVEPALWDEFKRAAGWNAAGTAIEQGGQTMTQSDWNNASWAEQPVSRYSLRSPGEDFAESLMMFIERPAVLERRSPGRYAFFATRRDRWRRHLVPRDLGPGDFPVPAGDTRIA